MAADHTSVLKWQSFALSLASLLCYSYWRLMPHGVVSPLLSPVVCRALSSSDAAIFQGFPLPVTPHGQEASQDSSENAARASLT